MDWSVAIVEFANQLGDGPFKLLVLTAAYFAVKHLSKMSASIDHLNQKMALIVKRTMNHEKRIARLENSKK